MFARAEF